MSMRRDSPYAGEPPAVSLEIAEAISKSSAKQSPSQSQKRKTTNKKPQPTKANLALVPQVASAESFANAALRKAAYYADDNVLIFNMDVREAMKHLAKAGVLVNCMVTSPPFYGQRDYGEKGQIGLEEHPREFINQLVSCFDAAKPVLAENGSLWVNLGDTYWSGKGEHKSGESKQSARRFGLRPQDRSGDGLLCKPKQLLLIPHRFAIAMQDKDWIVRNDNVWVKPNPIPDQVRDRCSMSHEYMFHLVKSRWYYFDKVAVGRKSESGSILPPQDTWEIPPARRSHAHKARFSEELVRIPILSTTPAGGVVLDPFGGSGTSLSFARKHGFRAIGIDIKKEFCQAMVEHLAELS
ncbi:site-specific DNA-methyltransferase [Achromobacter sp. Root565]|uniref:DNA-methyltransferase n=1 Tax=Achromobacter sp. Root565 TaxID=1736564 RepID=UPI0009E7EE04|nr:site-specific DNA-methyltransferase [Achromobacter sp. Root565]